MKFQNYWKSKPVKSLLGENKLFGQATNFDDYRTFLGKSLIYFDPSIRTPMNGANRSDALKARVSYKWRADTICRALPKWGEYDYFAE